MNSPFCQRTVHTFGPCELAGVKTQSVGDELDRKAQDLLYCDLQQKCVHSSGEPAADDDPNFVPPT